MEDVLGKHVRNPVRQRLGVLADVAEHDVVALLPQHARHVCTVLVLQKRVKQRASTAPRDETAEEVDAYTFQDAFK